MAGQDIRKLIPAGGGFPISTGGDYIYLKFADRPIDVIISGGRSGQTRVTMEAGDKYRPGKFDSFEIENPDKGNPAQVVFTVGEGDYNRQIVQGEIVVDPRVKTGSGDYVSDTRANHNIMVNLDYKREPAINKGTVSATTDSAPTENLSSLYYRKLSYDPMTGRSWAIWWQNNSPHKMVIYEVFPDGTLSDPTVCTYTLNGTDHGGRAVCIHNNRLYAVFIDGSDYMLVSYDSLAGGDTGTMFRVDLEITDPLGINDVLGVFGSDQADSIYLQTFDDQVVKITQNGSGWDGEIVSTCNGCDQINRINGEFVATVTGAPDRIRVWKDDYSQREDINLNQNLSNGSLVAGATILADGRYLVTDIDDAWSYNATVFELKPVEPTSYAEGELHYGKADETCSRVPALLNPALLSPIRTPAAVSVAWENGNAYVSGEVIRAVLDLLGIDTSGNYLDGITAFKAVADGRTYNINLGGRTFAADKIDDDFTRVLFPQVIELTALESLWSNRK